MSTQSHKGSILGCLLLITGCCIGAGMLGMPVITATAGFIPSTVAMLICCVFMNITGLLLLEAILWFNEDVNLLTLARYALGTAGQVLTWVCFVFLFYCLCVAYTIGCGQLLGPLLGGQAIGSAVAVITVGILVYAGTKPVDYINRILMVGLIVFYCLLVASGASFIDSRNLTISHWGATLASVPLLLISFGYQNLVPSITHYLHRNVARVRLSIILGSSLTFLIYVIWEAVILGILPNTADSVETVLEKGEMVTQLLQRTTGHPYIVLFAELFAFFAIATSLLANSLTCLHFLQDGTRRLFRKPSRLVLTLLVLVPPYFIALFDPTLFLKALSIAGGTATVILFGILPAIIVWYGRYRDNKHPYRCHRFFFHSPSTRDCKTNRLNLISKTHLNSGGLCLVKDRRSLSIG
jgi:tyrosine-specific transport protein